jgi:hydroxymethylpyrimidine pyrophosphatase-like HAD family hydrolase
MASPNGNHEDKDNKANIDIPSTTSAIERNMLEYMATQTQTLQTMTQTMVNIHQYIIEQTSNPKNPNLALGDNRQISFVPLSLDKEKLSVMQAQVLQRQKQTSTSPPHNTEITKAGVLAGPAKKQVLEAWNHQK